MALGDGSFFMTILYFPYQQYHYHLASRAGRCHSTSTSPARPSFCLKLSSQLRRQTRSSELPEVPTTCPGLHPARVPYILSTYIVAMQQVGKASRKCRPLPVVYPEIANGDMPCQVCEVCHVCQASLLPDVSVCFRCRAVSGGRRPQHRPMCVGARTSRGGQPWRHQSGRKEGDIGRGEHTSTN